MQSSDKDNSSNYLVLLNSESMNFNLARTCWDACKTRLCADGGANRLKDCQLSTDCPALIPEFIIGDLDSVRKEVIEYFKSHGTCILHDVDQETNDLDKCLAHIQLLVTATGYDAVNATVIILGAYGGRFDQEAASFHSLYRWSSAFGRIVLLGERATSFLLSSGQLHRIQYQPPKRGDYLAEGPTCGLIPLAHRVQSVTTTGLQWNLSGESLELGVRISSSNRVAEGATEVTVRTSEPILWTWANRVI